VPSVTLRDSQSGSGDRKHNQENDSSRRRRPSRYRRDLGSPVRQSTTAFYFLLEETPRMGASCAHDLKNHAQELLIRLPARPTPDNEYSNRLRRYSSRGAGLSS
jgi:hypothetical protein